VAAVACRGPDDDGAVGVGVEVDLRAGFEGVFGGPLFGYRNGERAAADLL